MLITSQLKTGNDRDSVGINDSLPKIGLDSSLRLPNECRICMEEETGQSSNSMISPCLCAGSVRFVHFKCMVQWIERNSLIPLSQVGRRGVFDCEMCKYKIVFECEHRRVLGDCQQVKSRIGNHLFTFILLLIIMMICVSMTLAGCYLFSEPTVFDLSSDQLQFQSIAIVCAVVLMFCLSVVSIYMWCSNFLMQWSNTITKILPMKSESPRKEQGSRVTCLPTEEGSPQMKNRSAMFTSISSMNIRPSRFISEIGQLN